MQVKNIEITISKKDIDNIDEICDIVVGRYQQNVFRWFISKVEDENYILDISLIENEDEVKKNDINSINVFNDKSIAINIIPTGIGCDIGGYAADAAPCNKLLSSAVDLMITNPNTVNGSNFISIEDNVIYTEGYMLDMFCEGKFNLYPTYSNKIGLIIEKTSKENIEVILNIVNVARAVYGIDIETIEVTKDYIGGKCIQNSSGAYVGSVKNIDVLFEACSILIKKGVNAIAVASNIEGLPKENYQKHFQGNHPNPVGGTEAIISHLICRKFMIPAAHAPMINIKGFDFNSNVVDARGAAEFASTSGLACILLGLNKAPQVRQGSTLVKNPINFKNVTAIICPSSALGNIPVLSAQKHNIPIIAVKENKTILDVNKNNLELKHTYEVNNYAEAAGLLIALTKGIHIPSLYRPLNTLKNSFE